MRGHLFSDLELRGVLQVQERKMEEEIDGIDSNRLLNTAVEDLSDYFDSKYHLDVPVLKEDAIQADHSETRVDVTGRFDYDTGFRQGPLLVPGTRIVFFVPFEGEADFFKCQPSAYTSIVPSASIGSNELRFTYDKTDKEAAQTGAEFQKDLDRVKEYLEWIRRDVEPFNTALRGKAKQRIEARREKLLRNQGLAASFGFPLRRRENAPETYTVPVVRKNITPIMPPAPSTSYAPEPALDIQLYDEIIGIMSGMVSVMERSPDAFRTMKEEDLRTHFLVQLNNRFGEATGETFNFDGKTDILIRANGRNMFIAECKFWDGPQSLTKAIDQVLGYATWRDTKIALLIFNRGRSLSAVLEKIPGTVKAHPHFKRQLPYSSETGFRFVLGHRDDKNRELILTVLVFEVPA